MIGSIVGFFLFCIFFDGFLLQEHHLKYFNNVINHSDTMTVMSLHSRDFSDTLPFYVEPFLWKVVCW